MGIIDLLKDKNESPYYCRYAISPSRSSQC